MKQQSVKNNTIRILSPEPTIRTMVIQLSARRWRGCIYLSQFDLSGQVVMLLKDMAVEYDESFLKNQIFVFKSFNKSGIEAKINEKLQTIIKSN